MDNSTVDNQEPENQAVKVRLLKSIFVKGQGPKLAGDIVTLDAEEARNLQQYNLFELVPATSTDSAQ
jgi:hypothetical protein